MKHKAALLIVTWIFALAQMAESEGLAPASPVTEIVLYRFFGGCADEYSGITDLKQAVGECGVIQVLVNKFNAENPAGVRVITQTVQAAGYVDRLSATIAARSPPDVAVMHQTLLPDFVKRKLVRKVTSDLSRLGVQWNDFVPAALDGVTFDGEQYGLPFDLHGLLWHVNEDLFAQAGLTHDDGSPRLPTSPEELLAHAAQMRARTGRRYFAIPSVGDPMPIWTYETWMWQQGLEILSPDFRRSYIQSRASQLALSLLASLYERGYAHPGQDYVGSEQAFLNGEAAVLVNGTWVVDTYLDEAKEPHTALQRYSAHTVPQLFTHKAAWADIHLWIVPRPGEIEPKRLAAILSFLTFLYDYSGAWARTGHLPVRKSVLESPEFLALPQRAHYVSTAQIAKSFQQVENHRAIQYALGQAINATWLIPRPPRESLAEADEQVQEILDRTHRRNEQQKRLR